MEVEISAEEFFEFAKRKASHLCVVKNCRNPRRARGGGRFCYACTQALWRARYPTKSAYTALRDHARRRRILFTLSFGRFEELVRGTSYIETAGNQAGGLQVDRVDATRGYADDNVQLLTITENSMYGNKKSWGWYSWRDLKVDNGEPEYLSPNDDNEPF